MWEVGYGRDGMGRRVKGRVLTEGGRLWIARSEGAGRPGMGLTNISHKMFHTISRTVEVFNRSVINSL